MSFLSLPSRRTSGPRKPSEQIAPCCQLGDITQITAGRIRSVADLDGVELDIVAGGPPCQSWSTAGKRRGLSDERGSVSFKYVDLVIELSPRYFVMENVRGLLSIVDTLLGLKTRRFLVQRQALLGDLITK